MFNNFKRKANKHLNNIKTKNRRESEYQIQTRSSTILEESTISSNSLSTISEESIDMAQPQEIFNNLRIPDVIKDLQPFDGNPKFLPNFVQSVEEILLFIRNTDNTPYGQVLLRAIRNKVDEALNNHLTPLNWDEIKKTLKELYTDKREESTLIRELHSLKQYNKTTMEFYNNILEIQALLITNIRTNETNQSVMTSKKQLYEDIALNVFLSGLKEPMGAIIRAMRPTDLRSALTFCQKEETIANVNPFNSNNMYRKPNYYNNNNYYNNQNPSNSIVPFNKRPYQNPHYPQQPKRFFNDYRNSTNNQQVRNFNNNNNYPQIKSTSSNMTRQNSNVSRNQFSQQSRWNRQNNLKMEELNNIDSQRQYLEDSQQNSNIDDTPNFQSFASNHQLGT